MRRIEATEPTALIQNRVESLIASLALGSCEGIDEGWDVCPPPDIDNTSLSDESDDTVVGAGIPVLR